MERPLDAARNSFNGTNVTRMLGVGRTTPSRGISAKGKHMPKRRMLLILAGLLLSVLSAAAGCSLALTTIPAGRWEGHGTYIDYEAVVRKDGYHEVETRSTSRSYETFLTIKELRAYGRPAVSVSIRSMRGELMNVPGDKTESDFLLVEMRRLPEGTVLYAVFPKEIQQKAGNDGKALPELASTVALIPHMGGAVLEIGYDPLNPGVYLLDTYTFSNDSVFKAGSIRWASDSGANEKKIVEVFGSEQLRKTGNP